MRTDMLTERLNGDKAERFFKEMYGKDGVAENRARYAKVVEGFRREFGEAEDIGRNAAILDALDYTEPDKRLDAIRSRSMDWLENALFSPKEVKTNCAYSSYDIRLKGNTDNEKV